MVGSCLLHLGYRAEFPQTRYPLICSCAFGFATSYTQTTLANISSVVGRRVSGNQPEFPRPTLPAPSTEADLAFSERGGYFPRQRLDTTTTTLLKGTDGTPLITMLG